MVVDKIPTEYVSLTFCQTPDLMITHRTLPTAEIMKTTVSKLRGYFAYYGVTDNSKSIQSFAYWVTKTLYKWLNHRGKRGCYTWEKFTKLLKLYPLPTPRIKVNLLSASR